MYWPVLTTNPLARRTIIVLALIIAMIGTHYLLYDRGFDEGFDQASQVAAVHMAEQDSEHLKQLNDLQEQANQELLKQREVEKHLNARVVQLQKEKENAVKAVTRRYTRLVNQLRDRLSRAEHFNEDGTPRDPGASTTDGSGRVCTGRQLSREDGEFLIGEAAKADTLRESLRLCRQAYEELKQRNQ
jgi:hypothetical protein